MLLALQDRALLLIANQMPCWALCFLKQSLPFKSPLIRLCSWALPCALKVRPDLFVAGEIKDQDRNRPLSVTRNSIFGPLLGFAFFRATRNRTNRTDGICLERFAEVAPRLHGSGRRPAQPESGVLGEHTRSGPGTNACHGKQDSPIVTSATAHWPANWSCPERRVCSRHCPHWRIEGIGGRTHSHSLCSRQQCWIVHWRNLLRRRHGQGNGADRPSDPSPSLCPVKHLPLWPLFQSPDHEISQQDPASQGV